MKWLIIPAPSWKHLPERRRRQLSSRPRRPSCVVLSSMPPATFGWRSARTPGSSSQPTPSSGCPRPVSAARTCGRTGGSNPSRGPPPPGAPGGPWGPKAELLRVPLADGTLVAPPDLPADDLIPSLLAASDVLGTGWFAAVAAEAGPGKAVAVVGDGAVGLLAVPAARELGAERIIAVSRHESRQRLAREFGATDIVEERGDEGAER